MVIMLVDALRADFIWQRGSRFAFVNDKIAEGAALPFTTRAHSPTVTLPRITAPPTVCLAGTRADVPRQLAAHPLQSRTQHVNKCVHFLPWVGPKGLVSCDATSLMPRITGTNIHWSRVPKLQNAVASEMMVRKMTEMALSAL